MKKTFVIFLGVALVLVLSYQWYAKGQRRAVDLAAWDAIGRYQREAMSSSPSNLGERKLDAEKALAAVNADSPAHQPLMYMLYASDNLSFDESLTKKAIRNGSSLSLKDVQARSRLDYSVYETCQSAAIAAIYHQKSARDISGLQTCKDNYDRLPSMADTFLK
ncbi:MAG: hypothetical protein WCE73_02885 [Candidatus Angelobacter sp.]